MNVNNFDRVIKLHSKNIFYTEGFSFLSRSTLINKIVAVKELDISLYDRELYHVVVLTDCNPYIICQAILNLNEISKSMEHSILVLTDDIQPWFLKICDKTNIKIMNGKVNVTELISIVNSWIIEPLNVEYNIRNANYIGLTKQEVMTLSTYMRVKSMKKASMILNVSTKTSYSHRSRAVVKLGFKNVRDFIKNGGEAFSDFFSLHID